MKNQKIIPTLCCLFQDKNIKFKTFTIKSLENLSAIEKANKIDNIYQHNIETLQLALDTCKNLGIESYRISSDLFPRYDYVLENNLLPKGYHLFYEIELRNIKAHNIILSMHPDQYCILNSPNKEVIQNSVKILKYHFRLANLLGIDSINIHVGGVYGDKVEATNRFINNCKLLLTEDELKLLTIENDEKSFNIYDVINICKELSIRPTFDIHHEKCYRIKGSTLTHRRINHLLSECKNMWQGLGFDYIQIHLSSPRDDRYITLKGSQPHSDYIDSRDIIDLDFLNFNIVVDIEAKHKELAVLDFNNKYFNKEK